MRRYRRPLRPLSIRPPRARRPDWLQDYLDGQDGRADSADIRREGAKAGHSKDALRRAKQRLGVVSIASGFPRRAFWFLPSSAQCAQSPGETPTAHTAHTGASVDAVGAVDADDAAPDGCAFWRQGATVQLRPDQSLQGRPVMPMMPPRRCRPVRAPGLRHVPHLSAAVVSVSPAGSHSRPQAAGATARPVRSATVLRRLSEASRDRPRPHHAIGGRRNRSRRQRAGALSDLQQ